MEQGFFAEIEREPLRKWTTVWLYKVYVKVFVNAYL